MKNGFKDIIITYKPLYFDDLSYEEREKIKKDFNEALGWKNKAKFSRKKNGREPLKSEERKYIENYFRNYNL